MFLRSHRHPQQAAFIELLFDVVFVFAFTRLSERLVEFLDWAGFYENTVLTLALWWVWYRMAWTTNRYDPNRPLIQISVVGTMLASLLMAAALPRAYTDRGLVFASLFVAVQVLRPLWLLVLGGGDRESQLVTTRILFWAGMSAVPWLAGIFTEGTARLAWWSVAVGLDYLGGMLDFPTPGLGRARLRRQAIAAEHMAERYRQFLVIAFGESILVSGIQFSPYGFEPARTTALIVAFTITILLGQIYFYRAGQLLPVAIAKSRSPGRISEFASYSHLIMVLGVGTSAVGDKLMIADPLGDTKPSGILIIFGGPAMFLVGRAMLEYTTFSRISWSRPVGILLLTALAPLTLWMPPLAVGAAVAGVLAAVAISNIFIWRYAPREPAPPTR